MKNDRKKVFARSLETGSAGQLASSGRRGSAIERAMNEWTDQVLTLCTHRSTPGSIDVAWSGGDTRREDGDRGAFQVPSETDGDATAETRQRRPATSRPLPVTAPVTQTSNDPGRTGRNEQEWSKVAFVTSWKYAVATCW